ncbi:MAG: methyltransferase family protein [Thermodesulfobacteriota bacterium]
MNKRFEKCRKTVMWIVGIMLFILVLFSEPPDKHSPFYTAAEMIGYALITIGILGRIWSAVYLAGYKNRELIQDGPFSICRNPSYVFAFIGLIGILIGLHSLIVLIVAPVYWVYYYFIVRSEEKRLSRLFMDQFSVYCSKVPRFLPNPRNYRSREALEVNSYLVLRAIIRAGFFMWVFLLLQLLDHLKRIEPGLIPTFWNLSF